MSAPEYYLLLNGQQCGPYCQAELRHQMSKNWVPSACLCWHEGLTDWETIEVVLGRPDPRLSAVPVSREFLRKLHADLAADVEAGRKKLLSFILLFLLVSSPAASAFLGDDKAAISREYGEPLPQQVANGGFLSYHANGYLVDVTFEFGRSTAETFRRLGADSTFPPGAVQGFLRAHADGKVWEPVESEYAGEQHWKREGATACFVAKDDPRFTIVSDFYDSGKPMPPRIVSTLAPAAGAKVIATIKGSGDKTSDPFTTTAAAGFTVEYQTAHGYLGVNIYRLGSKKRLAGDATLKDGGRDHTFVAGEPGTYCIEVTSTLATGDYTVTVRE